MKLKTILAVAAVLFALFPAHTEENMNATLQIGKTKYAVAFEENKTVQSLLELFPLSVKMNEWAGNSEYYARLSQRLDTSDAKTPKSFSAGDIALYNNISLVIFYADTTSTSGYVLLGRIKNTDGGLKSALENAGGKVVFQSSEKSAASKPDDKAEIAEIANLYKEMYKAMIAKDLNAMSKIHANSFVLVHMTGTRMNKDEYLAAVKDGTLNYYTAEHDDISVNVDGNKAALCGKSRVNAAVYGGGNHTWHLQQDMTLEKIGGEWKFTYSKASTY